MSRVYQEAGDAFRQVMLGKKGLKDIIYSSQAKNKVRHKMHSQLLYGA